VVAAERGAGWEVAALEVAGSGWERMAEEEAVVASKVVRIVVLKEDSKARAVSTGVEGGSQEVRMEVQMVE
jgi:hypothetical protein